MPVDFRAQQNGIKVVLGFYGAESRYRSIARRGRTALRGVIIRVSTTCRHHSREDEFYGTTSRQFQPLVTKPNINVCHGDRFKTSWTTGLRAGFQTQLLARRAGYCDICHHSVVCPSVRLSAFHTPAKPMDGRAAPVKRAVHWRVKKFWFIVQWTKTVKKGQKIISAYFSVCHS